MTQLRESQRIIIGAVIGALFGIVFGGMSALGAAHGDRNIRSGLDPALVFLLSFIGWTGSAVVITELWKYARDERSANLIGMVSVTPLVATSLMVASPRSEFFSVPEFFVFVFCDVITGIVVGEAGWEYFGKSSSESKDGPEDERG